jgi:hypothetical protein
MKNNLVFKGLLEQRDDNCEGKLRSFIHKEINITHNIEFGKINRFGKRPSRENDPPRPIVARFLYYNDLVQVKRAGKYLRVNEQFPMEIEQRRKQLYPITMVEKQKKSKGVLVRDRLYVNDEHLMLDNERTRMEPHRSTTRSNKRSRVSSTPDRE